MAHSYLQVSSESNLPLFSGTRSSDPPDARGVSLRPIFPTRQVSWNAHLVGDSSLQASPSDVRSVAPHAAEPEDGGDNGGRGRVQSLDDLSSTGRSLDQILGGGEEEEDGDGNGEDNDRAPRRRPSTASRRSSRRGSDADGKRVSWVSQSSRSSREYQAFGQEEDEMEIEMAEPTYM